MDRTKTTWEGQTLAEGRYRVDHLLDQGGMALVYKARDLNLNLDVVIKTPRPILVDDDSGIVTRFEHREIKAMVQLIQPHVVTILDAGRHEGIPYLVAQYLAGGSLEDKITKPEPGWRLPLPLSQLAVKRWLKIVAETLDAIHSKGFVHRDVKPANILFDREGDVFLSDFGIAKAFSGGVRGTFVPSLGRRWGTLEYMSPELVRAGPVDGRADQYSLAVMVHRLLCGRYPFEATNEYLLMQKHEREPPPPLVEINPSVGPHVSDAVVTALSKNPDDRFADCVSFIDAVLRWESTPPDPPVGPPGPPVLDSHGGPLHLGDELSNGLYEIKSELGEGGYAYVYLAWQRRPGKDVVVKVPKREMLNDPNFTKRFLLEGRLLRDFRHAHIVKIVDVDEHDVGEHKRIPFMVMEYCADGSLDDLRPKGLDDRPVPISPDELRGRLPDICDALDYVHRQGYVHRDVKPGNILFDGEGKVYLSDFGIAKALGPAPAWTKTGMIVGTAAYMAPEIILPRDYHGHCDGRADQYSVAAAVFDLLAGRPPFVDPDLMVVLGQHAYAPPPLLHEVEPSVSRAISVVVNKGLSKNPDDRYPDCASFCGALMDAIPTINPPKPARPIKPPLPPPPPKPGKQRIAAVSGLVAALIAFLLVVGLALHLINKHQASRLVTLPRQEVDEETSLRVTARVSDKTLFAKQPTFRLMGHVPSGCRIDDETTGEITWKPNERQGPGDYEVTVEALFSDEPKFNNELTFQVKVHEVNLSPEIGKVPNQEVSFGRSWSYQLQAKDPDIPKNSLKYELGSHPDGVRVEPSGKLSWEKPNTPGDVTVIVSDTGKPPGKTEVKFSLNVAPPDLAIAPFDSDDAKRYQQQWADYLKTEVEVTNSIGMKFALIPPGEFMMGSGKSADDLLRLFHLANSDAEDTKDWANERPQHRVRITKPFYLGVHEVTRGQFRQFIDASSYKTTAEKDGKDGKGGYGWNKSEGRDEGPDAKYTWQNAGLEQDDDHPLVNVSWDDAVAFCKWLSEEERVRYRLPTEAEWEYACRAGTARIYYHGDDVDGLARAGNIADQSTKRIRGINQNVAYASFDDHYEFTAPVGRFRPNAFGLCDMHGNVSEWCADCYHADYYARLLMDDPTGPDEARDRVVRGGSWKSLALDCRSANRRCDSPDSRDCDLGFRVAHSLSAR